MIKLLIEGGYPLKGTVSLLGAKNASIKLLIASLLTKEECRLFRMPDIGDVKTTASIIQIFGGKVKKRDNHTFSLINRNLTSFEVPANLGQKSRSASIFVGPLISRFGQAVWPQPGGCQIGRRPIERHLEGLKKMGIKINFESGTYRAKAEKMKGITYAFPKNTHSGTETLIIAAVLAEGKTVLENAAQEPEVDDLISFLSKMGAKIERIKPRVIEIEGVKKLHGAVHKVMFDRNEAVTFACAALSTKGDIFVKNAERKYLTAFLENLKKIGAGIEIKDSGIRFFYKKTLKPLNIVTKPHPGFMTDWQALWTVLMTQAKGKSVVHETIFENRFGYVSYLQKMGAKIRFFHPQVKNPQKFYNFNLEDNQTGYFHAIRITGPTLLNGAKISIPDIRAGATLILSALIARGKTILSNIDHIDRGYENLDGRLRTLGAKIERIN